MSSSSVKIHQANSSFDKDSLSMTRPVVVQGGTYFTKIRSNRSNTPYYVQFDTCKTKQGVVNTNKRSYIDLLYNNEDVDILEWFEHLQDTIISKIYDHKNEWFHTDMDRTDIENNFVNITKSFRGGKHHLIRVGLNTTNEPKHKGKTCVVFDEYENIISIDDIQENVNIEGILEVLGVRFTSKSFQVEMMCKQLKISQKESTFDKCMIRSTPSSNNIGNNNDNNNDNNNNIATQATPPVEEQADIDIVGNEKKDITDSQSNDSATATVVCFPDSSIDEESKGTNDIITSVDDTSNETIAIPSVSEIKEEQEVHVEVGELGVPGMFSENETTVNEKVPDTESNLTKTILFKEEDEHIMDSPNKGVKHVGELGQGDVTDNNDRRDSEKEKELEYGTSDLTDISSNFAIEVNEGGTVTSLKDPQEIYYEIYKVAKQKAREHKVKSITHYLEAKNIKNQYLLDDLDESDPDDDIHDYYYDSDITNQLIDNENYQIEESG